MKNLFTAAAFAVTSALGVSNAALISADGASASSEFSGNYLAEFTIDGSGLEAGFDQNSIHDDYFRDNHWTTTSGGGAGAPGPVDEFIEWTFNNPTALSGIFIWNHLSNVIANNSGYEPVLFRLEGFSGQDELFSFEDELAAQQNLPQMGSSQFVSFGDLFGGIDRVVFTVLQTDFSPNFTGLAEVIFTDDFVDDRQIPLPGAAVFLLSGLAAGGFLRRR